MWWGCRQGYRVALMVGRIWDAVNDPLIGILSDRTATKMAAEAVYVGRGHIFSFR